MGFNQGGNTMGPEEAVRLRAVLDRMVKEKEIAASFFGRMAESLEEVEQRRWFRRMAQDEKDQKKILVKHRRELCGQVQNTQPLPVSGIHDRLTKIARGEEPGLEEALALAIRSADEAFAACARAAEMVSDRSFRIFLKILGAESQAHRSELVASLRRVERERKAEVEELAA
jgi:rubrerythrin